MSSKVQQKLGMPSAEKKIELYSGTYFGACTLGGIIGEHHHSFDLTVIPRARRS